MTKPAAEKLPIQEDATIPDLWLAPGVQAANHGARERCAPALNAILWGCDADVTALLRFLFWQAELGLDVVETADLLLAGAATACPDDFLIVDCSHAAVMPWRALRRSSP